MDIRGLLIKSGSGSWHNDGVVFWGLLRPHLGTMLMASLFGLGLSLINGAIAWLMKPIMDHIFVNKSVSLLTFLSLGVFGLFIIRGVMTYVTMYYMNAVGARVVQGLREWVYNWLLVLPMSVFNKNSSGSIVSRILNDIEILQNSVAISVKNFLLEGSTVLILAFVALYRRWDLAMISFVVIPLIVAGIYRFGERMRQIAAKTRHYISSITTILHESLTGIKIIKAFTMEETMAVRYKAALERHFKNIMREVKIKELSSLVAEVLGGFGISIILLYGGKEVISNRMSLGDFFSFIAALLMIYTPLKRLSKTHAELQQGRAVLDRVREMAMLEPEDYSGRDIDICGGIEFRDVWFKYPDTNIHAIKGIDLSAKRGEIIALVGQSGAGKSTIADLVSRFWEPQSGLILFDGIPAREITLTSLRRNIGIVTQDVVLFNDTVTANILFGKTGSGLDDVMEAAKAASAHDFIMELIHGYDTVIGERGVRLSGGQRQRLSIARAILKNPPILILDEATSSLDSESEIMIQKSLERLMEHRTTIVIAHRLSTVQKADKIIVLDRGGIVEYGAHEDLIQNNGLYKRLYSIQFEGAGVEAVN